jgi:NAD(P)-dependent dehydrogenase (short-subunit alcohol dehydrogenase family)
MKTIEDTTEADFDTSFALNVKGPYFLVQVRAYSLTTLQEYILMHLYYRKPLHI